MPSSAMKLCRSTDWLPHCCVADYHPCFSIHVTNYNPDQLTGYGFHALLNFVLYLLLPQHHHLDLPFFFFFWGGVPHSSFHALCSNSMLFLFSMSVRASSHTHSAAAA